MGRRVKSRPLFRQYSILPRNIAVKGIFSKEEFEYKQASEIMSSIIEDVVVPLLNTSNEKAFEFNFPDFNSILFKIDVFSKYNILYDITKRSLEMVFKTQQIADDVNNLRNQITAIEEERKRLENVNEEGDDFVMDVDIKNEVEVDLDRVYILYQFYFGYPENGIFDVDKVKIIVDALREAEALQEPGVGDT